MPDPTVIEVLVSASTVIEVLVPGPQGPPAEGGGGGTAASVTYDNDASGLAGDSVQEALDELAGGIPAQALGAGASPTFAGLTLSALAAAGILVAGVGGVLGAVPNQAPNLFYAGPGSGAAAAPTFRAMVIADIPFAGQANGLATLDSGGKVPSSQLSALAITETFVVASQAAMLALTAERGDVAVRTDLSKSFILSTDSPGTLADWKELLTPTDAVLSVAGLTGSISAAGLKSALTLAAGDISGLGTAATVNIGTSGATIPLLDGVNTWSAQNTFAAGTITTSQPFQITQTLNAAGVTFTVFKVNVTDTASAAASLLFQAQVGGVDKFTVGKDAFVTVPGAGGFAGGTYFGGTGGQNNAALYLSASLLRMQRDSELSWNSANAQASGSADVKLVRDAANTLAQRNGTAAQRDKIFNTWTDASNGEWFDINWITTANVATIGTNKNGTGASRALQFIIGGVNIANFTTAGHLLWNTDGTYDIGGNGVNRPRNIFCSNGVVTDGNVAAGASSAIYFAGRSALRSASNGVSMISNNAGTDFDRLQFGGTTSSFPALKRSTTILQARLADDSAFAPLQGNLRTQANAVAETPTATHTMIVTDAGGTAYRVLCVV